MASLIENYWQNSLYRHLYRSHTCTCTWVLVADDVKHGLSLFAKYLQWLSRYMGQNDVTRGWYQPLGVGGCLDYLAHIALFISFDQT